MGVAASAVVADVALTREAGKNAKLAALLEDAGISSVEVMKAKPYLLHCFFTPVGIPGTRYNISSH